MNKTDPQNKDLLRYFSGGGSALNVISNALENASVVRIATAYFEPSGYQCLREVLKGKEVRLLLGRPDTGSDKIKEVIKEFIEAITSGPVTGRARAMEELRNAIKKGLFLVNVSGEGSRTSLEPRYLFQHAKLYISDMDRAVVTSSNFTGHGLVTSREAGYTVTDRDDVQYFAERFDYYYNKAKPAAEELLEILEDYLRIYKPFEIYLRSLIELYGLPGREEAGRLPGLAGYQRPVVSRMLRNIEDFNCSMLVASTGLGKTIMGAHAITYLRMEGTIDSAIVICPAGLRKMWRRVMRAARLSSFEFSYHTLSSDDWRRNAEVDILDRELKSVDNKTVIILDESHHLRNTYDKRNPTLRFTRIENAMKRGAKIIMMTATPYSRGVDDINTQLKLLPPLEVKHTFLNQMVKENWKVRNPSELSDTANCVVLTTPSVVRYSSYEDEKGGRYVIFSQNEKRYFPHNIHMRNIRYRNPCDEMIIKLFMSGALLVKYDQDNIPALFDDVLKGRRAPLMEARMVNQFCSSLAEADRLLSMMQVEGEFEKIRFQNQDELTRIVSEFRSVILSLKGYDTECRDTKIRAVMDILKDHKDEKAVIFCEYISTARYIVESLSKYMSDLKVDTTVDRKAEDIERIMYDFAPVANTININDPEDNDGAVAHSNGIQVLVATRAMAEGFNMQDASVLINFDLPWTVLILAQRMGRILRPWHEIRDIFIYNLIPSTMEREEIHLAANWKERLDRRNAELKTFTDIPVMVDKKSEFQMVELADAIRRIEDADLDLDQVFDFIEKADSLYTTSFIDDLAKLEEKDILYFKKLPPGIKSFKKAGVESRSLYILFRIRQRVFPAVFNEEGSITMNSDKMDDIMHLIRSQEAEEEVFPDMDPDFLDRWIEKCRNTFAAARELVPDEVTILCIMVLMPL